MVVAVHVGSDGFLAYAGDWSTYNIFGSFSRICVPLFFMLTGALLVTRDIKAPEALWRTARLMVVLIIWSYVYIALQQFGPDGSVQNFSPLRIVQGPVMYHLWYFYSLLGLYLLLPVLSIIYRHIAMREMYLFLGMAILATSLLPYIEEPLSVGAVGFDLTYFAPYAAYALLGAMLSKVRPSINLAVLCGLGWFGMSGIVVIGTALISAKHGVARETLYSYTSPPVILAAPLGFIALVGLGERIANERIKRLITTAGRLTLGVYLIHVLVKTYFDYFHVGDVFGPAWLAVPLSTLIIWLLSLALASFVRAVPFGRYVIP
jgi:surface polysaccharide O-acyltransferase-like enzyme